MNEYTFKILYSCGIAITFGVVIVILAIVNTPFIRFKETEILSSLFFLVAGVFLGVIGTVFVGGILTVHKEGVKLDD